MVEHAAVNRAVVGSSPTRGARAFTPFLGAGFFITNLDSQPFARDHDQAA